jgi:tetratricopeptide (TPR) repeat protein
MRRIAILAISLLAALPAFSQTPPTPAPAAAPAGAVGAAGATGATKGPHPKSPEENAALVAMFKATDADSQIKNAEEFLQTYPDTDYKSQILLVEAQAYHARKDDPKAIVAGEKALAEDTKSYETMLLLSEIYSRTTRSTDLDMDDRLTRSDKYAKDAIAELATAEKPKPEITDTDWAGLKQGEMQRAYVCLGLSSLLRKKYDEAKAHFDKAMTLYPDPLDMLYIERAYSTAKRYDDALTWIDKAAASPNANDQLKGIAGTDKTRVQALKKQQSQ